MLLTGVFDNVGTVKHSQPFANERLGLGSVRISGRKSGPTAQVGGCNFRGRYLLTHKPDNP